MSDLADLIARVEGATGPDYFIDAELHLLAHPDLAERPWWQPRLGHWVHMLGKEDDQQAPRYTDSIDAALSLVERKLPGFGWERIIQPDNTIVVHIWSEEAPGRAIETRAGTPVAICLALLRSLQAGAQN